MKDGLKDDVARWLTHENYAFRDAKTDEDIFRLLIKHVGSYGNGMEIFEPQSQPGILVIGSRCPLGNRQNARYLALTEAEKERFEKKIADYCNSIQAVHRFLGQDGRKMVGVYAVLDKKDQLNQVDFRESVKKVIDMTDRMARYLIKSF